jgi:hypothetical protein
VLTGGIDMRDREPGALRQKQGVAGRVLS